MVLVSVVVRRPTMVTVITTGFVLLMFVDDEGDQTYL